MKNKIIKTVSILFGIMLIAGISTHIASAATTTALTKGEKMLEEMINAESARSAELNVKLNPKLGIVHTLRKHSTGNDVKLLQQFLKVYGVYPKGLITGYFGPLTEAAVKKFQEKESVDPVGIAGPKTRARIMEISRQKTEKNPAMPAFLSVPLSASASATPTSSGSAAPQIVDAVLATDIAENGSAVASAASFASTTQNIYAVLSLKNAAQDAEVAYIRYFGNTYVDSGVSHPSRGNLAYFHFQWSLKPGGNRLTGNYSIVFYVNGKSSKTIRYTIY